MKTKLLMTKYLNSKKIRNQKTSVVHIADNFEEAKRNSLFLSKSKNNYPAKYFSIHKIFIKVRKNFSRN